MTDKPDENQVKLTPIIGEIEIPDDNPFEHDTQGRKPLCEELKTLISECPTPYVLALDSGWGNGKSVFLKMLKAHLIKDDFPCVYFDAWKSDFYDDPLPAMITTIDMELEELGHKKSKPFKKIANASKELLKNMPDILLSIGKHQIENYIGKEATNKAVIKQTTANSAIENYLEYHKAMETFKENFSNLAKNDKPLVFMIDELDRCRPLYALEVLEKIKHVFDTKNVFFIVALNQKEMEKTIKVTYGDINADIYLRKFFNNIKELKNNYTAMNKLCEKTGISNSLVDVRYANESFINISNGLADIFNLSIRDQEQVISKISTSFSSEEIKGLLYSRCIPFFFILKLVNEKLFDEFKNAVEQYITSIDPDSSIGNLKSQVEKLQNFLIEALGGDIKEPHKILNALDNHNYKGKDIDIEILVLFCFIYKFKDEGKIGILGVNERVTSKFNNFYRGTLNKFGDGQEYIKYFFEQVIKKC